MNISPNIFISDVVLEKDMANAIRALSMDAVQKANSGHPGMPMGMADVATVLFKHFMKIDPANPDWPDRDRFVLSAGHGSMLLYSLHHLLGYKDMPIEELKNFRQLSSKTAGHPEYGHALGIEMTTGPLGQGLSSSIGMALAEQMMAARFGKKLSDHYTYVVAGDGCLQEGISHEAIDMAGHLKLNKLIVLWDDNSISIDGATSVSTSMDQVARFKAAGWDTQKVDGHDFEAVVFAIKKARKSKKPSMIACKTKIGRGSPNLEGSEKTHGAPLGEDEVEATRINTGWSHAPFIIPENIKSEWEKIAISGAEKRREWANTLSKSKSQDAFNQAMSGNLPIELEENISEFRKAHFQSATKVATRKASQMVLEVINGTTNLTVGGSADLTGSNLTKTSQTEAIVRGDFQGRYIHYGIREHAMAAIMNGISVHGGFIPYGGTFMVFSDYARGAMRLSALMKQRVIYVLTHDSIGLGEDGPTHQPVEHLTMLRATPNMNVFRPCDIIETAECWEIALNDKDRPSVLALSRQGLPMLRLEHDAENLSARGAYILRETPGQCDVTLIATGSEVEIAIEAADKLSDENNIQARIVSMPCWEKFERQDSNYQQETLGSAPRVAIEAAGRMGWDRWIGSDGAFVGMEDFGASAPAADLYQHFGITAANVAETALELIKKK